MFFFQGLTMGLAYVAPIGMQNLFVIHSALSHSLRRAVVTALIVLFFDISLSLSCFYGIGSLLDHLPWLKAVILGTGTLLILYMAYGMIRQVPDALTLKGQPASLGQTVSKACIVTWMNPQAILDGTMLIGPVVPLAHGLRRRLPPRHYAPHPARHQRPLRHGPHAVRPPFRLYLRAVLSNLRRILHDTEDFCIESLSHMLIPFNIN